MPFNPQISPLYLGTPQGSGAEAFKQAKAMMDEDKARQERAKKIRAIVKTIGPEEMGLPPGADQMLDVDSLAGSLEGWGVKNNRAVQKLAEENQRLRNRGLTAADSKRQGIATALQDAMAELGEPPGGSPDSEPAAPSQFNFDTVPPGPNAWRPSQFPPAADGVPQVPFDRLVSALDSLPPQDPPPYGPLAPRALNLPLAAPQTEDMPPVNMGFQSRQEFMAPPFAPPGEPAAGPAAPPWQMPSTRWSDLVPGRPPFLRTNDLGPGATETIDPGNGVPSAPAWSEGGGSATGGGGGGGEGAPNPPAGGKDFVMTFLKHAAKNKVSLDAGDLESLLRIQALYEARGRKDGWNLQREDVKKLDNGWTAVPTSASSVQLVPPEKKEFTPRKITVDGIDLLQTGPNDYKEVKEGGSGNFRYDPTMDQWSYFGPVDAIEKIQPTLRKLNGMAAEPAKGETAKGNGKAPAAAPTPAPTAEVPTPKTQAEYDALPKGAQYRRADGKVYTKK